nr:hypothetical protein [Tanacetum cinerariifolium]
MMDMISLLKEFTKGKSPEKVLVREEVNKPVTKYINAISLVKMRDNKDKGGDKVVNKSIIEPIELLKNEEVIDDVMDNESDKSVNKDLTSTRRLKFMNALADQGSDVNIITISIYDKLTCEKPVWTNIRLSLANHSYIYPIGIAKDVLTDVAGFVYPVDFDVLDIKDDGYMPLILGTPFLTMARAEIKFDKGTMTLKADKYKIRFIKSLEFPSKIKERIGRDVDPMIPTNYVNRRILEWEERIKNCQENETGFNKWRSKVLGDKNLVGHNFFVYKLEKEDSSVSDVGVIPIKLEPQDLPS